MSYRFVLNIAFWIFCVVVGLNVEVAVTQWGWDRVLASYVPAVELIYSPAAIIISIFFVGLTIGVWLTSYLVYRPNIWPTKEEKFHELQHSIQMLLNEFTIQEVRWRRPFNEKGVWSASANAKYRSLEISLRKLGISIPSHQSAASRGYREDVYEQLVAIFELLREFSKNSYLREAREQARQLTEKYDAVE